MAPLAAEFLSEAAYIKKNLSLSSDVPESTCVSLVHRLFFDCSYQQILVIHKEKKKQKKKVVVLVFYK
jgi:hypothetical protein